MTVTATSRIAGPFAGSGSTGPFAFTFKANADADMYLITVDTSDYSETVLTLTTDYSVSRNADQNNNPGGSVTLVSALATGTNLYISTNMDDTQPTSISNQGGFNASTNEEAFDRGTIASQQQQVELDRCVKIPFTSESSPDVPAPVAETVIGFDDSDPPDVRLWTAEQFIGTIAGTDFVSVSSDDDDAGYLEDKVAAGTNVTLATLNPAGDEELEISAADPTVIVSSDDTTAGYLDGKLTAGTNVTFTTNSPAGDEDLEIAAADPTLKVSSDDTTAGYLDGKLVAGAELSLTVGSPAGNETLTVALDDGTAGTILGYDSCGSPTEMGPGTSGQILTSNGAGAEPTFQSITSVISREELFYDNEVYTAAIAANTATTTTVISKTLNSSVRVVDVYGHVNIREAADNNVILSGDCNVLLLYNSGNWKIYAGGAGSEYAISYDGTTMVAGTWYRVTAGNDALAGYGAQVNVRFAVGGNLEVQVYCTSIPQETNFGVLTIEWV